MKVKKLSIIIPVHNEERTLEKLLSKVEEVNLGDTSKEIIIIDDGSDDSTPEILKKYESKEMYRVFHNEKNLGKTQTVRKGILKSTGDIVVIQDADLEYEPKDFIEMLNEIKNNNADVVYGNRFGSKMKNGGPNYLGNKIITLFSNLFTMWRRFKVPDMETCYKMVKGEIFRDIAETIVSKSSFGLEPEVTAKLSKYKVNGKRLKLKVVDIHFYPRSAHEGKHMKALQDGSKAVWEIIKFNLFK